LALLVARALLPVDFLAIAIRDASPNVHSREWLCYMAALHLRYTETEI